jgi:hypothetical protein
MSRRGRNLRRLSLLLECLMNEEPKAHVNPPLTELNAAAREAAAANRVETDVLTEAAKEKIAAEARRNIEGHQEAVERRIAYRKSKALSE